MKYVPRIYRMRIKWVAGIHCKLLTNDFEENIYILKIWGNPKNIACSSAMLRSRYLPWKRKAWLYQYNCVGAWYNPVDWKQIWNDIKFKFRYLGI